MTQDEERQILEDAVDTFGLKNQLAMLQEECAELISAVSHYNRGRHGSFDNLIEEIVDVHIMLNQIVLSLGCNVETWKERKLQALQRKINEIKDQTITIDYGNN